MRLRTVGIAIVVFLVASSSVPAAEPFTHNFDLYGDYNQYLYSATGALVATESSWPDGPTHYWKPASAGVWGHVTYRYELPFVIEQATLYANILALSGSAQTRLDVSTDGTNWTTVASGYIDRPSQSPINVSDILRGSDTAYLRGSIYVGSGSTMYAQFLRTTANPDGWHKVPHVYHFEATNVPEPATVTLLVVGMIGLVVRRRRRVSA